MKRRLTLAAASAALAFAQPITASSAQAPTLEPVLHAAQGWVNGPATPGQLAGKVVVVDVFTFGCYNCKNVTPNLRALYRSRAKDVAIVGVHSPETPYEKARSNVEANLAAQGIVWPVAIDNDFTIWRAYGIEAWPTQLIFDRRGRLRKTVVGDAQDALVDRTIEELVAER